MTRLYAVSPATIPDLMKAVSLNFTKDPVVLHQVETDDRGYLLIDVKAYGDTEEKVRQLCEMAERQIAIILPARNKASRYMGTIGDKGEFQAELYHIGCYTHPSYGMQFIHRFENIFGDEITWKTSKAYPLGHYIVNCKVTGHTNFGNVEQTTVAYAKLEPFDYEGKQ